MLSGLCLPAQVHIQISICILHNNYFVLIEKWCVACQAVSGCACYTSDGPLLLHPRAYSFCFISVCFVSQWFIFWPGVRTMYCYCISLAFRSTQWLVVSFFASGVDTRGGYYFNLLYTVFLLVSVRPRCYGLDPRHSRGLHKQ